MQDPKVIESLLHEILLRVRKQEKKPFMGICGHIMNHIQEVCRSRLTHTEYELAPLYVKQNLHMEIRQLSMYLMSTWPKYSGNWEYPVYTQAKPLSPAYAKTTKELAHIQYWAANNQVNTYLTLWGNDPYGQARHELLNWLIEQTKGDSHDQ